jgi:uncharacterized sulfatase
MRGRLLKSATRALRLAVAAAGAGVVGGWLGWGGTAAARPEPVPAQVSSQGQRPNILWITSEDNGPHYGAYGDAYSTTPNIDKLAARGFRYRTAWSNGPVCGASRTALITGVYPESTGGEHMRSNVALPPQVRMYPALLRDAGYYVTNNAKTDYNYPEVGRVWDESSGNAHWKNRPAGKPFFAIFNINDTHEGSIRSSNPTLVHDPEKAPVPAHMPNTKEAREGWAQYYDAITRMDTTVGQRLAELDAAGLTEETIVMVFGDHGPGLPRSKRFPYNSGLQIGLVMYVPPKFRSLGPPEASKSGSVSDRLVSFVDLAPTLLSLAGVRPPEWMQGRAFMGPFTAPAPEFMYGFRGRADERYDMVRSVRDQRYVYLRNFNPHRPHGQHVAYLFQTPTTAAWKRAYDAGELKPPHTYFFEPKASEELYDLQQDPQETRNLATSAAHRSVLERMRGALDRHMKDTRDVGLLPEYEFHRLPKTTVYERRLSPAQYDFDRIYPAAMRATDRSVAYTAVRPGLSDANPIVRYWAAIGAVVRGRDAVTSAQSDLEKLLSDPEPGPRFAAAEALGRFGPAAFRDRAISILVRDADPAAWSALPTSAAILAAQLSLYTLNQFTDLSQAVRDQVAALPPVGGRGGARGGRGGRAGGAAEEGAQEGAGAVRGDQRSNLKAAIAADRR